ncbi:nuclear transport factor 2 family protein [Tsuneonella mangrovi]|uniref:nuclear transport factor 2 family protein n=1 Tax=Tsuneonella mangrovi TaxID=1982042 RepID=UPI000BA1F577|nr:nuclear transport factor 2 family protein [Tsuneonella mangrovi]
MSDEPKPAELLAEIYAMAGAQDWGGVAQRCTPDFTVYEADCLPFGGEWTGSDALQRVAAAMYGTWQEASVDIHEIVGGDEWAVVVLTLTMTSKRTGKTFSQTVNEAGRFENGLLKELRIHYFDAAEVAAEA